MKKHILSILGVAYVCFALIMATSSQIIPVDRDGPVEGHQDRVERENYRGDGYSQRLPGPARSSEAERQFGWRPEYLQYARAEALATEGAEDLRPLFPPKVSQPNCLIMWTADWCPVCKKMYPIIRQLREEGYVVYVLDYDAYYALAQKMNVRALPTCIIHKNKKEVARHRGVVSVVTLKKTLTRN